MTKTCTKCHTEKKIDQFAVNARYPQVAWSKSKGRYPRCRDCIKSENQSYYQKNSTTVKSKAVAWRAKNSARYSEYMKARYKADKGRFKDKILQRVYGITMEDYNFMLHQQGFVCACCFSKDSGYKSGCFGVDHCHKTGKVRDLLCSRCNLTIGMIEDNPHLALMMASYLFEHGHGQQSQLTPQN